MKKIIIMFLIFTVSCAKQQQLTVNIRISAYTDTVKVNNQPVLAINKEIKQGDVIETMTDGSCDIIINEKNILRLKPDTKLILNLSGNEAKLALEKGWLAGVTKKIFSSEGKFLVKTPTVTAAIRGTSFCLKVENEKSTYFCVCNGTIELKGEKSTRSEKVVAAHHSGRRFLLDKKGFLIEDNNPGLLYHDDKGIEDMAKIINESVDWSKPDEK